MQLVARYGEPIVGRLRLHAGRGLRAAIDVLGPSLLGSITHVDTSEPVVALTFDDGPHPEYTARLLDVLDRHGARATFFVLGMHVARHPHLVRRQVESGHVVGNHTWSHVKFPRLPRTDRLQQIRSCDRAIAPYGSRLFRPPWGGQTFPSRLDLWACGHQVVMWNVEADDWFARDSEALADQLVQKIQPGSIVLLHDGIRDLREEEATRRPTVDAVDRLLQRMSRWYRFVTVPDLLRHGRAVRVNWFDPWYW